MKDTARIQDMLDRIGPEKKNRTGPVFLNSIQNEFIMLDGSLTIPRIPVRELDYGTATDVVTGLAELIPEFLRGRFLLEGRKPMADQHSLQFIMPLEGRTLRFVHMFKIDLLFSGDSSTIIERATTDHYPSYVTNRIYYKSRIIPVRSSSRDGFEPIRMRAADHVEVSRYRHMFAMFEEHNARDISKELCLNVGTGIFSISLDLYQFIAYEYFTACMNVLYPSDEELAEACALFEPMFMMLYGRYGNSDELVPRESIREKFSKELEEDGGVFSPRPELTEGMKRYFERFRIHRNGDMLLKGWWRIDFEPRDSTGE